jgi:isopentenyldiphosphate isomerase
VEEVDLVDEEDRVVGRATRKEVRSKNLLHRSVGVLCRTSQGGIYVHRRTTTKDVFPGLYDMFAGGVVGVGEDYEAAARREIREELGIEGPRPQFLFRHLYLGPRSRTWTAIYAVTWDGPIRHQESEVAWGAYLTESDLIAKLDQWSWVPDGLEIFRRYLDRSGA